MRGGESGDRQPDRAGHREGWGVAGSLHTQALQVHRQQLPLLPPPPPQLPGPRPSCLPQLRTTAPAPLSGRIPGTSLQSMGEAVEGQTPSHRPSLCPTPPPSGKAPPRMRFLTSETFSPSSAQAWRRGRVWADLVLRASPPASHPCLPPLPAPGGSLTSPLRPLGNFPPCIQKQLLPEAHHGAWVASGGILSSI